MSLFLRKSVTQVIKDASDPLSEAHLSGLHKVLSTRDLTLMGIAAIVGAGIFSTIGSASFDGGPGIVLLFIFVAIACGFSALCYAEFASLVPVSGSAYTYSYIAFGEIIAWIIGWDLLMEYAIGNIAVAISWSDYFTDFINHAHLPIIGTLHIPEWLCTDYWTAQSLATEEAKLAWQQAPQIGTLKLICDLPAFLITVLITRIIYIGIKESKRITNVMVYLKLAIILVVLFAGAFYVQSSNWHPFLPNGLSGVFKGTAAVFFAYIGFDAISTTAEECKNPQRDLPKGMIYSLIICTVIYILIALILTGMTSYKNLNVGDPLSAVFRTMDGRLPNILAGIISVSAVIATASVLLVFQLGQPRIWMNMSRDGLLPPIFSKIHPKYKTPSFSTLLTGVVVGVPALFLNLKVVVDLTSVGTLFAFVLVCGGIMHLEHKGGLKESKFKTPYINAKWIIIGLFIMALLLVQNYYTGGVMKFLSPIERTKEGQYFFVRTQMPYLFFGILFFLTALLSFKRQYSLIPVLGFLCCSYLLCVSGTSNWERFLIWLLIGLIVYFFYGYRNSKLRKKLFETDSLNSN